MDRSFLRHAAVYTLATFLVQAGGFFLLPIYLRCLSPADYGVLEIVGRLAETVGTVLLLGGFRQALFTFYKQADGEADRLRVVTAAFTLVLGSCVVGGLTMLWLGTWAGERAGISGWLLHLAVLGILLEPLSLLPLTLIQARVESGTYVIVVVAQFLFRVGLCILLVRFLHWGVSGALLATALTGAVFGIGLSLRELLRGLGWPGMARLRAMVAFALPLLPGGLCFFVLHNGDRFFLLRHASTTEIGTYALGYKLAMIVRMLSLVPLYMVWSSRMYAVAREPDAPVRFGQTVTRILAAYLWVGLGLCLFAPEVVQILGGDDYSGAVPIVPPVILACFFLSAATLMDAGFFLRHRTGLKLGVTLATTVVMLVLYATLIPLWGGMGAALATLGGFAFLALATCLTTQRIFFIRYEWGRLGALLSLVSLLWLFGCQIPPGHWGLVGKSFLVLALPMLAWGTGLVNPQEKQELRELLLRSALGRAHAPSQTSIRTEQVAH